MNKIMFRQSTIDYPTVTHSNIITQQHSTHFLHFYTLLTIKCSTSTYFSALHSAVGYMHSRGVIHRDINPENIMVKKCFPNNGLLVKLVDVGFALIETKSSHKPSNMLIGTPG